MALQRKRSGALALRLIAILSLLGCARLGLAQGTWSVISLPPKPVEVYDGPFALAVDAAGNLYVTDGSYPSRIQKRDAQGNWSEVEAFSGRATALAVDPAGNLYVTHYYY